MFLGWGDGAGSDYAELGVVVVVVEGLKVSGGKQGLLGWVRVGSFGEASQWAGHERPGPNSLIDFRVKPPKHASLKKTYEMFTFVHWHLFSAAWHDSNVIKYSGIVELDFTRFSFFNHIFPVLFVSYLHNNVKTFHSCTLHFFFFFAFGSQSK